MKRLIIYDLDGTLVDTTQDLADAANYMLGQRGRPARSTDVICRYVGRGLHELVRGCVGTDPSTPRQRTVMGRSGFRPSGAQEGDPGLPEWLHEPHDVERGAALFRAFYATHLLDHSRLYPHAIAMLQRFQSRAQAVVTNNPDPYARHILQGLGVAEYFFAIIAGEAGYPKKPDPSSVQALMRQSAASPSDTVLVGDSPIDVETGRNAGVMTVGVAQGFAEDAELAVARPDVLVRGFQELLMLAREQQW